MTPPVLVLAGMDLKVRRSATVVVGRSFDLFTHPPPSCFIIRFCYFDYDAGWLWLRMFYPQHQRRNQEMKRTRCLEVPKVAGRSGQWRMEAEGGRSSAAAGAPKAFFYFLFFWMVEDVVCCKRLVIARK